MYKTGEGTAAPFPVRMLAGAEGPVGEEEEEAETHLLVVLGWREMAG